MTLRSDLVSECCHSPHIYGFFLKECPFSPAYLKDYHSSLRENSICFASSLQAGEGDTKVAERLCANACQPEMCHNPLAEVNTATCPQITTVFSQGQGDPRRTEDDFGRERLSPVSL